jgi:hypothetical protein
VGDDYYGKMRSMHERADSGQPLILVIGGAQGGQEGSDKESEPLVDPEVPDPKMPPPGPCPFKALEARIDDLDDESKKADLLQKVEELRSELEMPESDDEGDDDGDSTPLPA